MTRHRAAAFGVVLAFALLGCGPTRAEGPGWDDPGWRETEDVVLEDLAAVKADGRVIPGGGVRGVPRSTGTRAHFPGASAGCWTRAVYAPPGPRHG